MTFRALTCCLLFVTLASAQDASQPTPAEKFRLSNTRWTALDKELSDVSAAYAATTAPATRDELKKKYQTLIAESEKLLPELRASAIAAFVADPNKDPDVTKMLIGGMYYDYRRDDFDAVLALAKLLTDHKCDDPTLLTVAGKAAFQSDNYALADEHLRLAEKAGKIDPEGRGFMQELPERKELWAKERKIREQETQADDLPRVKLETNKGPIVIELYENEAPQAVANFINLIEKKFYDGLTFHRVLPGFMAQGGDPEGSGSGGPGYNIYCECEQPNYRRHFRGSLSMAHAGKDTGGSQFFLTFRPTSHLDGRHTCFGRVIEGLDVLVNLQRRDPNSANAPVADKIVTAEVLRKRNHAYEPTKVK